MIEDDDDITFEKKLNPKKTQDISETLGLKSESIILEHRIIDGREGSKSRETWKV